MPQEDNEAAELDHSEEVDLMMFPARDQSAEVVKPGEEAFDFPASAVAPQFTTVLGGSVAIVFMGRDEPDVVPLSEALVERIAVVGPVTGHSLGLGSYEALLDGGFDEFRFMRRSAGDAAGERKTMAVCDRHDYCLFRGESGRQQCPFFAELKLASMNVSERSSLPRARKSSARACNSRVRVPSRCHR